MRSREGSGLTDGQLLEQYLGHRDEAALALLVHRHAPMVWRVCRRVLPRYHDAEDAFQATFLVFVRRAAAINPRDMLANWLYGVAHQTARKARVTSAKRSSREGQVTEVPDPAGTEPEFWTDLRPVLDDELSRLPDKYRAAIVLCDLEGRTRKEAARHLGVPEGTLAARLTRGRTMLAGRLARRGLTVSGCVLGAVLGSTAGFGSPPRSVVVSTIKAAGLFATGRAAEGVISAKVAALAEGVVRGMLYNGLKLVVVCGLAAGVALTALAYQIRAGDPPGARVPAVVHEPGKRINDQPDDKADKEKLEREIKELREALTQAARDKAALEEQLLAFKLGQAKLEQEIKELGAKLKQGEREVNGVLTKIDPVKSTVSFTLRGTKLQVDAVPLAKDVKFFLQKVKGEPKECGIDDLRPGMSVAIRMSDEDGGLIAVITARTE
jgi:RNA polymerase sigma factor (sigma-70 family)